MTTWLPPITDTDRPCHPALSGNYFMNHWACRQPWSPRDWTTLYDWRCVDCVLLAQEHIEKQGDDTTTLRGPEGMRIENVKISLLVARSKEYLGILGV